MAARCGAGRIRDQRCDRPEPRLLGTYRRVYLVHAADLLAVLEDAIVLEVLESRRRTDAGGAKGEGSIGGYSHATNNKERKSLRPTQSVDLKVFDASSSSQL